MSEESKLPDWWPEALEALRGMVREEIAAFVEERKQVYLANIAATPLREGSIWPHIREEASAWLLPSGTPLNVARKPEEEPEAAPEEEPEEEPEAAPVPIRRGPGRPRRDTMPTGVTD